MIGFSSIFFARYPSSRRASTRRRLSLPVMLAAGMLLFAPSVSAQTRDFLTEQEAELIQIPTGGVG